MATHIKIIHSHEFIKATLEGVIDINESKKLLIDISSAAEPMADYEIILDARKANSVLTKTELWYLAKELSKFHKTFYKKIAVICPTEKFDFAGFFALCSENNGFRVNAFKSLGDAMEWLIEV
jgi:hypothetical protein